MYQFILKFFVGAVCGLILGMFLGGCFVWPIMWMGFSESVMGPALVGFVFCCGLMNGCYGKDC